MPGTRYIRQAVIAILTANLISIPSPAVGVEDANNMLRSAEMYEKAERYYRDRDYGAAAASLEEALAYNENNVNALMLLGEIKYYSQNLQEAKKNWEKALALVPSSAAIKEKLEILQAEMKQEGASERLGESHFEIRLEKDLSGYDIHRIREILREAYRDICGNFKYYPSGKVSVIIYSEENYAKLAQAPEWSRGVYDGKIRIPVARGAKDEAAIKGIIWHEYTHALVRELTLGNCPAWLNEGLAKFEEAKHLPKDLGALKARLADTGKAIPLAGLSAGFDKLADRDEIALAYQESCSVVSYLIGRYGFWRIGRLLANLKEGAGIDSALNKEFGFGMAELEKRWYNYLKNGG